MTKKLKGRPTDSNYGLTNTMFKKVVEEVESFRIEYENYTSEMVEEYVQLLDDFTPKMKSQFIRMLGY